MRHKDHILDLDVADVEVGGDVHRIILSGIRNPSDTTALDSRERLIRDFDGLRRLLISYPYGTEDMCADFLFDSRHAEAAHGYVIMESMGYPYYSGSNTIATVAALLEYGIVPIAEGDSEIALESPGGLVRARYEVADNLIQSVTVTGDSPYVIADGNRIDVPDVGPVDYALVWSGAYMLLVDAGSVGLRCDADHVLQMKEVGRALTDAVARDFRHEHAKYGRIESPGFVHFMDSFGKTGDRCYRGRGATYGYPATVYRCPTGTGTSARMALALSRGEIEDDAVFESVSAMDNRFLGRARGREDVDGHEALRTTITARPFVLATTRVHIDFDNPLMAGYENLRALMG